MNRKLTIIDEMEFYLKEDEIKYCAHCGKPISCGMTDDFCDIWVHEGCFEDYMNKTYGKGNWKPTENHEEDGNGGYYLVRDDENSEWYGSGIYYTEWWDDYEGAPFFEAQEILQKHGWNYHESWEISKYIESNYNLIKLTENEIVEIAKKYKK